MGRGGGGPAGADREIDGHKIAFPSLDIATLGAGGGSIARVDAAGTLRVGPESAGAEPGPACYGRGGTLPTVTDANLVLGHLDADNFLAGRLKLDRRAAEAAIDGLARDLGIGRMEAAEGVYRLVNSHMAEGIRLVTVRRGVDPASFALFSFGGAAGAHVSAVARQLGLTRIIVPRQASVLSAAGMLSTSLRLEIARTHVGDMAGLDAAALRAVYQAMEREGRERLARDFEGTVVTRRRADMRYGEQIFEIDVPLDDVDFERGGLASQIAERFHRRHEELFTYALRGQDAVLVNARTTVTGVLPPPPPDEPLPARPDAKPVRTQLVHRGAAIEAPVFRLEDLAPGQRIAGPALVETETTTVMIEAEDVADVTDQGWLDIAVG